MTVISTIITRRYTAHASDSLITPFGDHEKEDREWQKTKIIPVRHWRGAMSYWGLATTDQGWNTVTWLRERAHNTRHFESEESFARALTKDLTQEIENIRFSEPRHSGLGIHLTVYERVKDYWVPELFKVSNWTDNSYTAVFPDGFKLERVTFRTLADPPMDEQPEHGEPMYRLEVHRQLQAGLILTYNNGDPVLFNQPAGALSNMIRTLVARGVLKDLQTPQAVCALARRPIEVVMAVQRDFCSSEDVRVGGRPHDLAITPEGEYWSGTGDDKE